VSAFEWCPLNHTKIYNSIKDNNATNNFSVHLKQNNYEKYFTFFIGYFYTGCVPAQGR
jgi:hypothetical protein